MTDILPGIETQVVLATFGNVGSDAGYWILTPNGLVHVGGWEPALAIEFTAALTAVNAAVTMKNTQLRDQIASSAATFINTQAQGIGQMVVRGLANIQTTGPAVEGTLGDEYKHKQKYNEQTAKQPPVVVIMMNGYGK